MGEDHMKHLNTEADPLTSFMFGKDKYKRNPVEMNDISEMEDREFDHPLIKISERDWLFGTKEGALEEKKQDPRALSFLNKINIGDLIENIEVLIHSVDQLKPLYKKATPLINQFLKKS
ncbi:hypothetical protein AMS60_04065 [Bacillus sp. FJAT-21945]|nr:hypothetical protein AMS60_04065 [Bacillus sp. FJAT-21945]